jgi:hypothetical protein
MATFMVLAGGRFFSASLASTHANSSACTQQLQRALHIAVKGYDTSVRRLDGRV